MKRHLSSNRPGRDGFTMVELLVAMALIVFIMYILAEAFSAGAKTFRDLKGVGDLNSRLRTATNALRRLLAADHFEGRKRLSDPEFWKDGPPRQGFFRIWQSDGGTSEGNDLDGNASYRTTGHHLHFTARLRGSQPSDFFRATVPTGSPLLSLPLPDSRYEEGTEYHSQWAEIAIYLKGMGENTEDPDAPSGSPLPLNTLYLRQRLLVPSDAPQPTKSATSPAEIDQRLAEFRAEYPEASYGPPDFNPPGQPPPWSPPVPVSIHFNTPADVSMPVRRFKPDEKDTSLDLPRSPGDYPTMSGSLAGSDILLTDVISMDVRLLLGSEAYSATSTQEEFISLFGSQISQYLTTRPGSFGSARVFDTWSSRKDDRFDYSQWNVSNRPETIPIWTSDPANVAPIRIRAIQITLRIWDSKTKQSRQVSVVQDL